MRNPTLGRHARNARQSAHPELWGGLSEVWSPELGNQGSSLIGFGPSNIGASFVGVSPATDWTIGDFGLAIDYANTNSYAVVSIADEVRFPDYPVSVTVVFKANSLSGCLFSYPVIDPVPDLIFSTTASQTFLHIGHGLSKKGAPSSAFTVGKWTVITITMSSADDRFIFVDGADQTVGTNDFWSSGDKITIGSRLNPGVQHSFDGEIGLVMLHNRIISLPEISKLALDPLAPFRLKQTQPMFVSAGGPTVDVRRHIIPAYMRAMVV